MKSNPFGRDPRETRELSEMDVVDIIKSNDPYIEILHLGSDDHSIHHTHATLEALRGNTSVHHLNLKMDKTFTQQEDIETLVSALSESSIQEIDIMDASSATITTLFQCLTAAAAAAVQATNKIQSIWLWDPVTDMQAADAIAAFLASAVVSSNCNNLTAFAFRVNTTTTTTPGDQSTTAMMILRQILTGVLHSHTIETLDIFCCHLGVEDIEVIGQVLSTYQHLKTLKVSPTGIGSLGALTDALRQSEYSLHTLGVDHGEDATPAERLHFATSLPIACPMLSSLTCTLKDVEDDIIFQENFVQALLLMMMSLPELTEFIVDTKDCRSYVSRLTPVFSKVERLDLQASDCDIYVLESLVGCTNLRRLKLYIPEMEPLLPLLRSTLLTLTNLEHLDLQCDIFTNDEEKQTELELSLLDTLKKMKNLVSFEPNEDMLSPDLRSEIQFDCMLRSINRDGKLLRSPPGLFPHVLEKLATHRWYNIMYHVVSERQDVLIRPY